MKHSDIYSKSNRLTKWIWHGYHVPWYWEQVKHDVRKILYYDKLEAAMKERKQINPAYVRKVKEQFPELNFTCDNCRDKHDCPMAYGLSCVDGACAVED